MALVAGVDSSMCSGNDDTEGGLVCPALLFVEIGSDLVPAGAADAGGAGTSLGRGADAGTVVGASPEDGESTAAATFEGAALAECSASAGGFGFSGDDFDPETSGTLSFGSGFDEPGGRAFAIVEGVLGYAVAVKIASLPVLPKQKYSIPPLR